MESRLRIGMVMATLPSRSREKEGGVTYMVHKFANKLVERGHDVIIHSLDTRPGDALYRVKLIKAPSSTRLNKFLRYYLLPFYVAKEDFESYDIIHTHGDDWLLFFPEKAVVRTFYGSALGEALSAVSLKRKFSQLSLYPFEFLSGKLATKSIAISQATIRHLPFVKTVIPCGVNLEQFRPSKEKSNNPSILFVGMMVGRKRGSLLVDVFRDQVRPAVPGAELWMVCREEVKSEGLIWFGKLPTEELIELYQKAWVFCLPSSYEAFGVPYIEAMACGTPVVATPNMGAREVLEEGDCGVICKVEELGRTLIKLLKDKSLRNNLELRGLEAVKKYSWNNVVDRYEAIYKSAIRNFSRDVS